MNRNFIEETVQTLIFNGKSPEDVQWVGSSNGEFAIDWKTFIKIADVWYDAGYGSQKIARDLVVVGHTWWLERHEYDGSEFWEFKTIPHIQDITKSFTVVGGNEFMWDDLSAMNTNTGNSYVTLTPVNIVNGFTESERKVGRKFRE